MISDPLLVLLFLSQIQVNNCICPFFRIQYMKQQETAEDCKAELQSKFQNLNAKVNQNIDFQG